MDTFRKLLNKYGLENEPFCFIISYDLKDFFIHTLKNPTKKLKFELNSFNNKSKKEHFFNKTPICFSDYEDSFKKIQEEIKSGNSYLLNLTAKTKIDTNLSLDEIYDFSNALLKLRFKDEKFDFVSFSPEKFVEIKDDKIYTYPMKGTINSSLKDAKEILENSKKELAEHTMVVDLLRNDLGKVAKKIRVEKFRFFEKIELENRGLYQTSSKISGELSKNWKSSLGDIILNLLPAGSITGTPKKSTVNILNGVENYNRGFYTGIFGLFDGNSFQSFVLIRFIENIKGELFYKSGGGITLDSDVKLEYEELISKVYLPF